MCELLIDSKGFSSGSRASQPLYLGGLARQIARQFIHLTPRSGNRARMAHLHRNECRNIGGKVGCNSPTFRSLWAPHLKYPCRCWYERAGSRRSCSKYHELVRAVPRETTKLGHVPRSDEYDVGRKYKRGGHSKWRISNVARKASRRPFR